jgi:rhodanese-related sulfurtransferase
MKTIKEVTILIGVSVIAALAFNFFSSKGIALVGQWDTSLGVVNARQKNDVILVELEIGDVTYAKALYDSGNVLFVDARSAEDYADGHIKGAYSLPVGEFDAGIDRFLELFALDKPIVTYCSGRSCEDSHHLAQLLIYRGYQNTSVMVDGFPGWESEGYPIE